MAKWQIFFEKNHCSKGINWCKAWLSDKGDMCKGNFRWQVEGTHQPEFPQITLRFSAEVAPSQKQTAKNKSPIKEISTTESKYLSLHKIQYPYVMLKLVDQNASRWGRWGWPTHVQIKCRVGGGHGVHVLQNKRVAYYSCSTSFSNPLTWHTQLPELHSTYTLGRAWSSCVTK